MGSTGFNAHIQPIKTHEDICVFGHGTPQYFPQLVKLTEEEKKRASKSDHLQHKAAVHGTGEYIKKSRREREYKNPATVITIAGLNNGSERVGHPTQKPVELFRYLVRTYTEVGQVVFDPCVGSGTTAIAAREEDRRFIVGDSSAEYVQVARDRLAAPYTPSFMPQLEAHPA